MEITINVEEYELYEKDVSIERISTSIMNLVSESLHSMSSWSILSESDDHNESCRCSTYVLILDDADYSMSDWRFFIPFFSFDSDKPLFPQLQDYVKNVEKKINEVFYKMLRLIYEKYPDNQGENPISVKINLFHNQKCFADFNRNHSFDKFESNESREESSRDLSLKMNEIRRELKRKLTERAQARAPSTSSTQPKTDKVIKIMLSPSDIIKFKNKLDVDNLFCLDLSDTDLGEWMVYFTDDGGTDEDYHPRINRAKVINPDLKDNPVIFDFETNPFDDYIGYYVDETLMNDSYIFLWSLDESKVYFLYNPCKGIHTITYEDDDASTIDMELLIMFNDINDVEYYERYDGRYTDADVQECERKPEIYKVELIQE